MQDEDTIATEAARWHARLASGNADARDREGFEAWRSADPRHAAAAAEMAMLWQAAESAPRLRPTTTRRRMIVGSAVAAIGATGLLVLPRRIENWGADAVTAVGERRDILLPDGLAATLNTDTVLRVEASGRLSVPRGEIMIAAMVQGARAPALSVTTPALVVRYRGGSFAVAANGPRAGVQVVSGSVDASGDPASPAVLIKAVQRLRIGTALPEAADPLDLAWPQGVLAFRQRRLDAVAAELDLYRSGRTVILSAALRARRVSGSLSLDRPDTAVEALASLFGLSVRHVPLGIIFLGDG